MSRIRQALSSWQFLFICVVFFAVLGLIYLYRQPVMEILLVPILYLLWLIDLALQIFGQQCVWTSALMIALILSWAFSRQKEKPIRDLDRTVYGREPAVGRIQFWRRRVRVNSHEIRAISYRRPAMRQLIIQALVYRENSNFKEIEKKLRAGELSIPAEVSNILGLGEHLEPRNPVGWVESIKLRIAWIMGRFITPKYTPNPQIEKVADYLENLLEVDNDAKYY